VDWRGVGLRNPVGLAAGLDKDCRMLPSLSCWGFGYLTAGTVTEGPRPGNPKPRMFRYVGKQSLINALGFPGNGLEEAARRLERARPALSGTPVSVSISGTAADEIVRCHRRLEPLVDAVELNISSPNTEGLKVFHEPATLAALLGRINTGRAKPLMVKLPPYPEPSASEPSGEGARAQVLSLVRACADNGVDGLTVANTWPTRDARLAVGMGGLSGRAVFPDTIRMVREVRDEAGSRLAINACGGIFSGDDAWKALQAGADTVQLYTGIVYQGPAVVRQINRRLLEIMAREGVESLRSS
jgi:dihydroorotate dehydrogenase